VVGPVFAELAIVLSFHVFSNNGLEGLLGDKFICWGQSHLKFDVACFFLVDLDFGEIRFELPPSVLHLDFLPVVDWDPVVTDLVLIFIDKVEEDVRNVLVLIKLHLDGLFGVPHRETMLHSLHLAHCLEFAHSDRHRVA